jgi:hypothetical protein
VKIKTEFHTTPQLWIAYDDDTYDGAEDAHPRSRLLGIGKTPEEAEASLRESAAEYDDLFPSQFTSS